MNDDETLRRLIDLVHHRYWGKHRGIVIDNDDPEHLGRVQVQVPAVLGEVARWALPCVPYAGDKVGFFCPPEPKSHVWVEFEGGDPTRPIWVGCFWAKDQLPDLAIGPAAKIWRTPTMHLRLDEDASVAELGSDQKGAVQVNDQVVVTAGEDATVTSLTVSANTISAETGAGGTLTLDGAALSVNNGSLEVS